MEQFCKSLPKIELHAHLNGSLSKATLLSLGCVDDNVKEYQKLTEMLNKSSRTLDECFELFQVAHDKTNNAFAVHKATQSVIQEFYEDNVIYLELRTTPRVAPNMSRHDYIQAVVQSIKDSQRLFPIIVKLILCLDRKFDATTNSEVMNLIIQMHYLHPDIIVGVDLCGNPKVGYFPKEEFARARMAGLKVSLHCAEVKSHEEEMEILAFWPDRLGHGTFLHPSKGNNKNTFNVNQLKRMPLEICLSSNVICGTVEDFSKHHIKKWLKYNLPFCLCTDDKGVFMSDLSHEYYLAHQNYNLSAEELCDISFNTINFIFACQEIKGNLRHKIIDWKGENLNKYDHPSY